MSSLNKIFASILLLLAGSEINAATLDDSAPVLTDSMTVPGSAQPTSAQTTLQARVQLEELNFHMQALQTILSEQPQNMTRIKTETSWIRKLLASLHQWSLSHSATPDTEQLLNKFCRLIGNMEEAVNRDDMLDSIELQELRISYTQAEHTLTEIARSGN